MARGIVAGYVVRESWVPGAELGLGAGSGVGHGLSGGLENYSWVSMAMRNGNKDANRSLVW